MSSFILGLKNYAVFRGRTPRRDFWLFQLFAFLIAAGLTIVDLVVGTYDNQADIGLLSGLFFLAIFLPNLSITARRLHDTGKSGWFLLLFLIPCVGVILWIIFMVQPSQPGANQYGPNPHEVQPTV